jgi:site-specific recombinase XerD
MQNTLCDYAQYCKDRLQLRPGTLHERTVELTIFLDFLHSRKARTLDQIQSMDLSEFLSCRADLPLVGKIRRDRWLQPKTVARIVSDMRSFLRFLVMRGILQKDLTVELPKIRVARDAAIPSVWDQQFVVRLLKAVDRSSPKGKRDYAILLLACRLGLRVGDITGRDSVSDSTKAGYPFATPHSSDSASREGNTVYNYC